MQSTTPIPVVGNSPTAEAFYSGRYQDVLAATVDSLRPTPPEDLAFAVGALAFVGRVTEAASMFSALRRTTNDPRTLCACAFFVAVSLCRGGHFSEARSHLIHALRATHQHRDPWARAMLLQGTACVRYFTGALSRAVVTARLSLECAQRAAFPYLQLLSNDLRGHALTELGRLNEGLSVLEHARSQAERLGYTSNAHVIAISIALHRSRMAAPADAENILTKATESEHAQDSYTRRMLRLELAVLRSLQGRASEASILLEEAARLCADERRLLAWLATARAQLARVQEGPSVAMIYLQQAEDLLRDERDTLRRIEVAGLRLGLAHVLRDTPRFEAAAQQLRSLAGMGNLDRARGWLWIYGLDDEPRPYDEMSPILRAVARGSLISAVRTGLLGIIPEARGMVPGRRIHILNDATLIEDFGNVVKLDALSARSVAVLSALGVEPIDRETLFARAWGLRGYDADRHDTLIKTAISRLRQALGTAGSWMCAIDGGYALTVGVEVALEHAHISNPQERPSIVVPVDAGTNERQRKIIDVLQRVQRATVGELSLRLREPVRTLSRELSSMCAAGIVAREGAGRTTSYSYSNKETQ
jgi:tetratricopeptide (TPR) repeat protein